MIENTLFGRTADGAEAHVYTLRNQRGCAARISTYGAVLTELHVPDRHGALADVVLGFDDLAAYLDNLFYLGATVGRVANRIAHASFALGGVTYELARNNGRHHLHGGIEPVHKRLWAARAQESARGPQVALRYLSPDGEEGYPGNLDIAVTYTLTEDSALEIDYTATTDTPTPVNLTNHSYFNLSGAGSGDVLGHILEIAAARYTPADSELIPTGDIQSVEGTRLDFRTPVRLGERIRDGRGYDVNYVLHDQDRADIPILAAQVSDPVSGRLMQMHTTEPGVQLYTADGFDGSMRGKGGVPYPRHAGLCLEAQHHPDAVHQPRFPSIVLMPGQIYRQTTIYAFATL